MNIGQVAKQTGFSAKSIRYFEEIGLLTDILRSEAGYRIYSDTHLRSLHFIQQCRTLGFSYADIQALMQLWQSEERQSRDVKHLAQQHILRLKQKVSELERMIDLLQRSVDDCAGNADAECSILNQLEHDTLPNGQHCAQVNGEKT